MIITLTGENAFLRGKDLRSIVDAFVREHGDLALEKLDGEEASYERLQESLQSLPFLASKKLVVLRSPGSNKQFTENIAKLSEELPEITDVIVVEPKLDKRLAYYKFLKKLTEFREFPELDMRGMAGFVQEETKRLGGAITAQAANYLVERVGPNQQAVASELQKLVLFNPAVTQDSIDTLTEASPQSKVFDLIDAAFAGNHARALGLYAEQRQQKVEPQAIMGMLAWQLHVLALVKFAGDKTNDVLAKEAKINPFVIGKTQGIARRMSQQQVKDLVQRAVVLDHTSKTKTYDLDEALQDYILQIQ
ncbi:MAG: DNA polymerase III subunit delta [Candidatus Saccharimonadales bacterium]